MTTRTFTKSFVAFGLAILAPLAFAQPGNDLCSNSGGTPSPPPPPPVHVVNVSCCAFTDSSNGTNVTIVAPGTTVQWVRLDGFDYSVTSGTGCGDPQMGVMFNGFLGLSAVTYSHTFTNVGTYPYFCMIHESLGMTGVVHVMLPAIAYVLLGGCISSNGAELTLGNSGPPRLGDPTFALSLNGGVAGGSAYVFIAGALAASPQMFLPDCFIQLDLQSLANYIAVGLTPTGPAILNASGSVTFPFPIPLAPGWSGQTLFAQALVIDALAPGGLVLSNAVQLIFGA
jgi:hypothetical protein